MRVYVRVCVFILSAYSCERVCIHVGKTSSSRGGVISFYFFFPSSFTLWRNTVFRADDPGQEDGRFPRGRAFSRAFPVELYTKAFLYVAIHALLYGVRHTARATWSRRYLIKRTRVTRGR